MIDRNLTIPEIAKERGLAISTIEGHLAVFVETGTLAIDRLLAAEKRQAIAQKLSEMRGQSLGEIKQSLGDGYSYGEIKFVQAHLKCLAHKDDDRSSTQDFSL